MARAQYNPAPATEAKQPLPWTLPRSSVATTVVQSCMAGYPRHVAGIDHIRVPMTSRQLMRLTTKNFLATSTLCEPGNLLALGASCSSVCAFTGTLGAPWYTRETDGRGCG